MADDLGRGEAATPRTGTEAAVARQAVEKPDCISVTSAGSVDNRLDRFGVDGMDFVGRDNDRALLRAGQRRHPTMAANVLQGVIERAHLVERDDFVIFGEQDIDVCSTRSKKSAPGHSTIHDLSTGG